MNDKAAVDRAREEVEILEAEHERELAHYARYMAEWGAIAQETAAPGKKAYASKRNAFYQYLYGETVAHWAAMKQAAETAIEKAQAQGRSQDVAEDFVKEVETQAAQAYARRKAEAEAAADAAVEADKIEKYLAAIVASREEPQLNDTGDDL